MPHLFCSDCALGNNVEFLCGNTSFTMKPSGEVGNVKKKAILGITISS